MYPSTSFCDDILILGKRNVLFPSRPVIKSYLSLVIKFATSSFFALASIVILFVITVQLFTDFTGRYPDGGTHGKARAGRPIPIANTKHGAILTRNEITDRVWLSFVITILKRKEKLLNLQTKL